MTWNGFTTATVTAKLHSQTGEAVQNVFSLLRTGGGSGNAEAIEAIGEWLEEVYTPLVTYLSEEAVFSSYSIILESTSEALGDQSWPTLTGGAATGDQLPASNCLLALFRTGVSRHVGRKYFGPFSEAHQDGGSWVAGVISNGVTAAAAASDPFTASNGVAVTPVIVDRVTGEARPIVSAVVLAYVRSQRRRNRLIGI